MVRNKNPEDNDPVLAAELNRALAPYRNLVPPEMLEVYRDILRMSLTEHPVGKALLDRVKAIERKPPSQSGEETKEGANVGQKPGVPFMRRKPRRRR